MRIGFDGKRAVQNFTGLGNYSRYVADILCHFYPENDYVLYAPKKRENKRMNLLTGQYRQLTLAYPATSFWKKLSSYGAYGESPLNWRKKVLSYSTDSVTSFLSTSIKVALKVL